MQKNKITDIFFDLDHTLWDFEANSKLAFEKLLKEHRMPVDIDTFIKVYEPINTMYWMAYSRGTKTKEQVKYNRLINTFNVLNIPVTTDMIKVLANGYLDYLKHESVLMDGTIDILNYLKDKYRLHILTNGFREVQDDKMKHSGIAHFFENIITSEEVGELKPHPEVFNHALKKAKTFAHNSYMIGDNLKSDILGARNVGMFVIHYDPKNTSNIDPKIIPRVQHLREIIEML